MVPRLPEEAVEDFRYADDPEFMELRSKLARWGADTAPTIGDANPAQPWP